MLKRFFISVLGAFTGFWLAISLMGICLMVSLIALVVNGVSQSQPITVKDHSILHIDLSGSIVEKAVRPHVLDQIAGSEAQEIQLSDIVNALNHASTDKDIDGVYIEANGASCGLASAQELIRAIEAFKKSGKWVIAYGDAYTQGNYTISCHADSVFINPMGAIDIHGLGSVTPFFKGLADKLGIEVQVIRVGTYKSAVEPYVNTEMSAASREQTAIFLSNMWKEIRTSIANARGLKPAVIDSYADSVMTAVDASDLTGMKLVDGIRYMHQVEESLASLTDRDDPDDLRLVSPAEYCAARHLPSDKGSKHVAVLYAQGEIVDAGDEGIVGPDFVDQIFEIADDDDVDALLLRVDSPGGSVFASEQIWEALEEFKKRTGKPFYVSMSNYAASGGYYISCGADKIFAEPATLTGSIGIFGLIPNIHNALSDKLGINTETVTTNPNANFPTILEPMTPQQRVAMQGMINRGYNLFLKRVANGRKMKVDSVNVIAQGRVWDGRTAMELGLVDHMGGMDAALSSIAERLQCDTSDLQIHVYPDLEAKWWKAIMKMSTAKVKSQIIEGELDPQASAVYRAIKRVRQMSTAQARIDFQLIQ